MFGLKKAEIEVINAAAQSHPTLSDMAAAAAIEIAAPRAPVYVIAKRTTDSDLSEYAAIAAEVGVEVSALALDGFLAVLEKLNYPIYNRAEVVAYMDHKAKMEGLGHGWEWRPVRAKDHIKGAFFGVPGSSARMLMGDGESIPASDFYCDPSMAGTWMAHTPHMYDKTIPLHALKRIVGIEREYQKPVHFLVSDYSTAPHVRPDPFLMAVIPGVPSDAGRFVIDFWDEPGFGIDKMLA